MTRELTRRSLLASGGALVAGSAVGSAVAATGTQERDGPPALRWSDTYDGAATDDVQDALRTAEGTFVVGQSGEDPERVRPWAFAVDDRGRPQWERRFDADDIAGINGIAETDDGSLLLAGYSGQPTEGQTPLFMKVSVNGELQWRRTVESPRNGGNVASLLRGSDGEYVAIGLARGGTLPDVSGWVFGVDGEAERQWSETYGPRHSNYVASVAATGDGGYVVGGGTRAEAAEGEQPPYAGWLFAVDGEGSQQWSGTYEETTEETDHQLNFFYDVYATESGYLAAGGSSQELYGGQRGWVLSVDRSGERQQRLLTRPTDMEVGQLQRIRPFEEGYALVGVGQPTATDPASVWAVGIDGDLSRRWSAAQQFAGGSEAITALETDDGGLMVFGNANVEGGQTATDALVLKLGGDPVATTPGTTTQETDGGTATPSPTATPTPTASPTPTPTATGTDPATDADPTTETGPSPTDADDGTTADDGAGFGIGTALAALGGGALLRRTRRSDDSPDDV